MLEYRRYRDAAAVLAERFEAERGYLYRSAPLPPELRRVALDAATAVYDPDQLGAALGDLLTEPPELDLGHIRPTVSLERRLRALRDALARRASFDFDEQFGGEDRLTQAVTLFALLELYRKGEVTWEQREPFGPIEISKTPEAAGDERPRRARSRRCSSSRRSRSRAADLAEATEATEGQVAEAIELLREDLAEGKRGVVLREVAGGFALASDPASEEAARRLLAKPRTPPLTQAQAETLAIVAYLQPVSRPEVARIRGVTSESAVQTPGRARPDRGVRPLAVRRRDLQDDGAVRAALRPLRARPAARPLALRSQPRGRARAARAAAQGRRTARRERWRPRAVRLVSSSLHWRASLSPAARRAEEIIAKGRVTVGGEVVTDPARDVGEGDDVRVNGEPGGR